MKVIEFKDEKYLEGIVRFFNSNVYQNDYVPFENNEEFVKTVLENKCFNNEGLFLAVESDIIIGIALAVVDTNVQIYTKGIEIPGYINFLIVDKKFHGQGVRTELLEHCIEFLNKHEKYEIVVSHKSPIKLAWNIPTRNVQHNKAPGVIVESSLYTFLLDKGFIVESFEVSYYLDLLNFNLEEWMIELIRSSRQIGYEVTYFDPLKHIMYEEMFNRLNDESYREKFRVSREKGEDVHILVKNDREVCGITGHLFTELNGRGNFQGISVDPIHSGKKLGNLLFFSLCNELKSLGSKYMTLFVSEDNFAKNIYEKVGFIKVQKWAIMSLKRRNL